MSQYRDKLTSISSLKEGRIINIPFEDEFDESEDEMVLPDVANNPCLNKFKAFRDENMKPLYLDKIYKRILKDGYALKPDPEEYKIKYEYELYIEGQDLPFDCHKFTKKLGVIDEQNGIGVLPGLMEAICSMEYKETALFWISYEMMYGVLGVIDKIPPKSDIVAKIQIAQIFDKYNNEIKPQPDVFSTTMRQAKDFYKKAYLYYKGKRYGEAINNYKRTISLLENLRLANDAQERDAHHYLVKCYGNLAFSYNHVQNYQRTCLTLRDLERITSIADNQKMLFCKAEALLMLNDLNGAEKLYRQCLKLDATNIRFTKGLNEIKTRRYEQQRNLQIQQANHGLTNEQNMNLERYFESMDLAGAGIERPNVELFQNYTPPKPAEVPDPEHDRRQSPRLMEPTDAIRRFCSPLPNYSKSNYPNIKQPKVQKPKKLSPEENKQNIANADLKENENKESKGQNEKLLHYCKEFFGSQKTFRRPFL